MVKGLWVFVWVNEVVFIWLKMVFKWLLVLLNIFGLFVVLELFSCMLVILVVLFDLVLVNNLVVVVIELSVVKICSLVFRC